MSFAARPTVQAGASAPATGVQSLGSMDISGNTPSSQNRTVSLALNPDGTAGFTNQMIDPAYQTVPSNWYTPTTASIGTGYRVKFTLQSGNAWDTGLTSEAFYALDAARTLTWTLTPTTQVNALVLVEITATGSSVVLGSGTLYINLASDY